MTYRTMIAPLRSERTDRDLNRSPDVEPKHRTRSRGDASRFERLAAAAEELHGWPALLDILLGVAAPVSRGGGVVPAPIWIDEGMYRTHCMINLALRLEDQMTQQGNRDTWSASCLAKAMALAGRLAELKTLDDHEALPCSELISEIAVGLLQLFRLSDGDLEARIVLENVALTACKRRALILATTALVMQTIIDAMDRGCAPAISIDLAARGSGQWRLAFTEVDVFADDNDARACDDIVDGLADLLGAPNVRRFRRMSEFVTEIDFPCLEVGAVRAAKYLTGESSSSMGTDLKDNCRNRISVGRSRHMSPYLASPSERAVIRTDRRALLQIALLAPFAAPRWARAAGAQSAALDPILTLNNGLLSGMKAGKSIPFVERYNALSRVVENAFDLPEVLRRCIGSSWSSLAATEQAELLEVFQRFTITSYVASFNSYAGQRFEIEPSPRAVGIDFVVETHLVPLNGEPSRLDYMMHAQGNRWRIVDVLLDGTISRVAVQRSDFRRFLASHDSSGLISSMQQKIVSLSDGGVRS